jgi:hypothetical protein
MAISAQRHIALRQACIGERRLEEADIIPHSPDRR